MTAAELAYIVDGFEVFMLAVGIGVAFMVGVVVTS